MDRKIFNLSIVLIIGLMVLFVFIRGVNRSTETYEKEKTFRKTSIENIDLSKIKDGTYLGDFTHNSFLYQVEVTVKDHSLSSIRILKNRDNNSYAMLAEEVIHRVISAQSLEVESVSYATTSSKALLKAIENALKKGVL